MKIASQLFYLGLISFASFFLNITVARSQTVSQPDTSKLVYHEKGYLLFYDDELSIFLPDTNASKKYNLARLSILEGQLLRGVNRYAMYSAKVKAKKYIVQESVVDKAQMIRYTRKSVLKIIPVLLSYTKYYSIEPERKDVLFFSYKKIEYRINFIDDWDVSVLSVSPI